MRPVKRVGRREPLLRRPRRPIIPALVFTALVIAGGVFSSGAFGAQDVKILGRGGSDTKPDCGGKPDDFCTAIGSSTIFVNELGKKSNPFRAPSNGRIVAWAIELGHKPSKKPPQDGGKSNLDFFQDLFGNDKYGKGPVARIAILKRQGGGIQYKLTGQSPAVKLSSAFYKRQTVITLDQPLAIKEGEVVGLTTLTWAPAIRQKGRGGGKSIYRASMPRSGGCTEQDQINAKPQKKVGTVREYGCKYDSRVYYKAYFVPN